MNIQLEKDIWLSSDEQGFTLKQFMRFDKNEEPVYKVLGYYSTLEQSLNGYTKYKTRTSEATTLQQVINEIQALKNHINLLVKGELNEKIKSI